MRVVLSFDDGRSDNYENAFPILKKYGLTASIHITTGFIDGSFVTDEFGKNMKPIPVPCLAEMAHYGIDVSSHGDKHKMDCNDFIVSQRKIHTWTGQSSCGFSVPNSSASKDEIGAFINNTKNNVLYVRVGRDSRCKTIFYKIFYLLYKITHLQLCYNFFNRININYSFNKYYIKSVVIKRHTRAKNICNFVKKYSRNESVLVLMLHSITEKPENPWEWSLSNFEKLCAFLKQMLASREIDVTNLKCVVERNDE